MKSDSGPSEGLIIGRCRHTKHLKKNTHIALPQNDHPDLSFVKFIHVVGKQITKNGKK